MTLGVLSDNPWRSEKSSQLPIGNSLSKEVRDDVSNSGSSSFKRLMDSSHVDAGSSGLCTGVEPPMALSEEQPTPVMTIVPSSLQEAMGRGDGDEVRVSP